MCRFWLVSAGRTSSIRTGLAVRARCFHAREIEPAVRMDPQRARWIAAKTDVPSAGLSF